MSTRMVRTFYKIKMRFMLPSLFACGTRRPVVWCFGMAAALTLVCTPVPVLAQVKPLAPIPAAAAAQFKEVAATHDTVQRLRSGGYALYLRHGLTDNTRPDRTPAVDLADCTTQRPLADAGRQQMAHVGDSIRKAGIALAEIRVSPMCRARDSAAAAFPKAAPVVDSHLMYVANFTTTEKEPIIANTRRLLSMPVPPGTNRLVLAHAPNLMDLMGYFPKEGTLVVFRPLGESQGYEYVASILPTAWDGLLK